jgi:tetratricopeptide (TPR) repeat protein
MMGQFDQAEGYLARAERLTAGDADPDGFAELSIIRCQVCTAQADFDSVIRYMDGVVASSMKLGNDYNLSLGLGHTATSQLFLNRYDEARRTADEALALARRIGDRPHEAEVLTFTYPLIYIRDGEFDRAMVTLEEGLQLAQRIGAISAIADASWLMGQIARLRGEYEAALVAGQRAFEAATPLEGFMPFYLVHAVGLLGSLYLDISDAFIDKVAQFHRHALRLLEEPVGAVGGAVAWADLGWCALTLGDLEIASEVFTKGLNYPTMMMNMEKPRHLAGTALLHSLRGEAEPAGRLASEACAYAEQYGLRHLYPLVRLTHGRVLAAAGRHEEALVEFAAAEATAREMGQQPLLWQTHAAAGRSLLALGRDAEAAKEQRQARAVVDEIGGLFADEALRSAFLESAQRRLAQTSEPAGNRAPVKAD